MPGHRRQLELVAVAQQDQHGARFDERPAPLDDQLEDALELDVGAEGQRDGLRRLKPPHRAFELATAFLGDSEETGVLDRDPGPAREHDDRAFVGEIEVSLALLGEIEVPHTWPRMNTGTPRKLFIGGWPAGNP